MSANKPFHIEVERLSLTTYCPDGIGRWFYERAAGSYNTMLAREGTTPARLKKLKAAIPTTRRLTKTDLAKIVQTWEQKPEVVSLGAQKNFEQFMASIGVQEQNGTAQLPEVVDYKRMVAKAILFKSTQKIARQVVRAFSGNVAVYTLSLLANRVGDRFDFDRIWTYQAISDPLQVQLRLWVAEVAARLEQSSAGRMISEWAKKAECWRTIRAGAYTHLAMNIPEIR